MPPPSYARATASSAQKASPNSPNVSKTKDPVTPTSTPKKLKRPSTLTPQHRQNLTYKADLYPIHPRDPSKPCGLATLPSELRTCIYQYALLPNLSVQQPDYLCKPRLQKICFIWPRLLHICQAIRIEAAYEYYTTTPFVFFVRNLDFNDRVMSWLEQLPPRHRALLTRNRNLRVRIMPGLRPSHTYPPKGWLLDGWMGDHWEACSGFGNLYTVASGGHQTHFLLFCRLMKWFQLNASMPYRDMRWEYNVDHGSQRSIWDHCGHAETLWRFLSEEVGVLAMTCVAKAWKRGRVKGKGREEALKFFDDMDKSFERLTVDKTEDLMELWESDMRKVKEAVKKW